MLRDIQTTSMYGLSSANVPHLGFCDQKFQDEIQLNTALMRTKALMKAIY